MTKKRLKYLRNNAIEEIVTKRIREFENQSGKKVSFPIPIERIAESLGLQFDWDIIEEKAGEQILAGLIPQEKIIMMNEKHLDLFKEKPGLERSTIGHELGHWDIDIDHSTINYPVLQNLHFEPIVAYRKTKKDNLLAKVLKYALYNNQAYQVYKELNKGKDSPEVKSAVDRYQSYMLMPEWLIKEALEKYDKTNWSDLYNLAEEAGVSISNLTVRLQRLGLIYIPKNSKKIYSSIHDYRGQKELF